MVEVIPKQSIGEAELGLTIEQMRAIFDNKFTHSVTNGIVDYFDEVRMEVEYVDNKAVYIGLNVPEKAQYNGVKLGELTYRNIKDLFRHSEDRYGDYASLTFMDLGIAFYFEDHTEVGDQKARQVSVFSDGYYHNQLEIFERLVD